MTTLLDNKNTRAYILRQVKEKRPGWNCTRVSANIMLMLDQKLKVMIDRAVQQHPSSGQTFREMI